MVQRQPAPSSYRGGGGSRRVCWLHSPPGRALRRCYQTDLFPGRNLDEGLENVDITPDCIESHCR